MNRHARIDGRGACWALFLAGLLIAPDADGWAAGPGAGASRIRRPVSLALSQDGSRLFAANARSGSLSVVDIASGTVEAEHDLGRGLAQLSLLPDGRLLAVDRAGDALLLIDLGEAGRGATAKVVARRSISPDPVTVAVAPGGASCVVASLQTRRLTFVDLPRGTPELTLRATLDLPFAPRALAFVSGRDGPRLVVADAFGGRLALVDPARATLEAVRSLPAHNIGGMAVTADGASLVLTHQSLRRLARTSFEDIHWGSLVNNHLRAIRVPTLLDSTRDADLLRGSRVVDLGGTGNAAGDPGPVALDGAGGVAVALSGVNELALGASPTAALSRVAAGKGPAAVALPADGGTAYVANAFDDTITVVDARSRVGIRELKLGDRPEPDAEERGERLFRDARLSHDGWMSCHSCHTDGHTNGLFADTLGDGSHGTPKRVPTLRGVGATGPWNWTGSQERLEDQVRKSIETTMHGRSPTDSEVADLTAFLRSLPPPPPAASPDPRTPADALARGRTLFRGRKCVTCHEPPAYTSARSYDVGLADEAGHRTFNPPSLRGVGSRESLLHDGRAGSLEELFESIRHPAGEGLAPGDRDALIAFLKTL